jgi:hypothetical protein
MVVDDFPPLIGAPIRKTGWTGGQLIRRRIAS